MTAQKDDVDPLDTTSAWVLDTTDESGWETIRRAYANGNRVEPLEQLIRLAKGHGVKSILVERRYVDPDWRSMCAKFYGSLFQRYSPTCHRLHLFSEIVRKDDNLSRHDAAYKGFTVLRPIPSHPVGRTMIRPPAGLTRTAYCLATETVRPLGYPLRVEAMPFMSQDAEYLRCSHVVQWMVLYHAHLLRGFARRLPAEIHLRSQGGYVVGRQVPSVGLSMPQMLSSLDALGLSPATVVLPSGGIEKSRARGGGSLPATLCRYVNSQMPPIVLSENHAWVVVGHRTLESRSDHDAVSLFIHDDMRGPYLEITNPWEEMGQEPLATTDETKGPTPPTRNDPGLSWSIAVPPLPQRVNLSADRAEIVGKIAIMRVAERDPVSGHLRAAFEAKRLTYRTYAIRSNEFKATLQARGLPRALCDLYRYANWPGFIWVVEVLDRTQFERGEACVFGEAVIDSTATHVVSSRSRSAWPARGVLAVHVPGKAAIADEADQPGRDPLDLRDTNVPDRDPPEPLKQSLDLTLEQQDEPRYYPSGCATGNW